MNYPNLFLFSREMRPVSMVFAAVLLSIFMAVPALAAEPPAVKARYPFRPGEKLTYNVSWSDIFSAGTAVMEVKKEKAGDGREVLHFISTARTTGMVDKAYTVRDTVNSIVEYRTLETISYDLSSAHNKRKKQRKSIFDHDAGTVTNSGDGGDVTLDIPEHTQDALSSLFYLRTMPEFVEGKTINVNIHDTGKNWAVEVYVLGREKIKTPVGEFNTIKVKTYPKYEGVFMHKGEIFMWFTDDKRRIPVLMQSTITIGSVMATLTDMKLGDDAQ